MSIETTMEMTMPQMATWKGAGLGLTFVNVVNHDGCRLASPMTSSCCWVLMAGVLLIAGGLWMAVTQF